MFTGTSFPLHAGIKYGNKTNLKALGMMFMLSDWIIRTAIYATDVNFTQKVTNSSPVCCEIYSITSSCSP
jgi:hypothetical protein